MIMDFTQPRIHMGSRMRLVTLALLLVPATGFAQTPDPDWLQSIDELMAVEVTSASKREKRLADTAAAAFVLTRDDIRRSGANTVPGLLRLVPGLQVAQMDGNKWAITARGFNSRWSNKLLVMIEWPAASAGEPLLIGVLGDELFSVALRQLDGRIANGRQIVVKAVDESDDLASSSILYIGLRDDRSAAAALARVARSPVLTVGERARFTQNGGIVRLYTEASRLRFEINLSRSRQIDLRISSKLLGLAKIVKEQE